MDKEMTSKKRRISEKQDEKDAIVVGADSNSKARITRSITLDMSKYSQEIQELSDSDLVKAFEIGLAVKQSFTLKFSENSDLIKQELQPILEKMDDIETSFAVRIDSYDAELNTVKQQMHKPAYKGSFGESMVMEILKKHFPADTITDVSKEAGKGDIHIETPTGLHFLVEVKTYAKSVPKPEIEKFRRDVGSSHEVKVGLMFSLNSGISAKCKNGKFQVDFDENKFLIYVPNALEQEEVLIWCVHLAKELAGTSVELKDDQAEKLRKLCDDFQERVNDVKKCRENMKVLKKAVEDLDLNMQPLLRKIEGANKKIKDIIKKP